jgi:hypothetical protein
LEGATERKLFRNQEMDFGDALRGQPRIPLAGQGTDPSATLGQYGEAEKLKDESDEPVALYHVWFDAEGECELLPADKTRVLSTQPVKKQKTNG